MRRALDWLVMDGGGHAVTAAAIAAITVNAAVGQAASRSGAGVGRKRDQVPDIQPDADPFADVMIMVRGNQRQ
ncbi:hypothetical protein FB599_0776 [Herbaspirillum sp. SJZ130]|nr:hypothetical protein FB599_0776 [Herbaspirillum sp. SJZ130]TQK15364.1 hypothetical protein FB598_0714 [Herbaspirillum sp. SJZ106]TWC71259.1 hypothetical protein FB597_101229 [Herbaspirillum sp. SJZ099]